MGTTNRIALTTIATTLLCAAAAAAGNTFLSTWKNPSAAPLNFAGRKVAAIVIVDDENVRMSAEEALAREITARGPIGVASYRLVPRQEFTDKDRAKAWFERAKVEGAVVLRLMATDTQKVYSSVIWGGGYYTDAWDYYGYGWAEAYPIGKARNETTITVETTLYDLTTTKLVWAGVTRTADVKDAGSFMKQLTKDVVKTLEKEKLVQKR